jgi:hypothetical protein
MVMGEGALVVRPEVVRLFLLVLLEKLKPCSPATRLHIHTHTHTHTHILILIHACTHAAAEPDGHRYSSDQPGIWTRAGVRRGSVQ